MADIATILLLIPGKTTEAIQRPADEPPKYQELRQWVGGLIQPVYMHDDPLGYWWIGYVDEEGLLKRLPFNAEASKLFSHYDGGLVGPCVFLEGFHSWWWIDNATGEAVRAATKRECLNASKNSIEEMELDGRRVRLGERE